MRDDAANFGTNLRKARLLARTSQALLSKRTGISRTRLVRLEKGIFTPTLPEAVRLAAALRIPLQKLTTGNWRPARDLRGIAIELFWLGIRDLEVPDASVPGAFRRGEQVLVLALQGNRPEPRVVEAVPFVLAQRKLNVPLTLAFARLYDPRAATRLGWLSDITLALARQKGFLTEVKWEAQLSRLIAAAKKFPTPEDSLGHPGHGKRHPIWLRWSITYAADLEDFRRRSIELEVASRASATEPDE